MLRVLDLFSGIGGFSLGLERTGGFETVAFCEIDPFCRKVLAKHWPKVRQYEDVRTLTAAQLAADGISVDVICGGFPCQDISRLGSMAGLRGERSGLWSHIPRLAKELGARVLIVENVVSLLGQGLRDVLSDLHAVGFDAEWHCIPASFIGARQRRDRIWIVAYAAGDGRIETDFNVEISPTIGTKAGFVAGSIATSIRHWECEPDVGRVAHGVPARVDRLRSLGNAVVPQIPELIGNAILASHARAEAA